MGCLPHVRLGSSRFQFVYYCCVNPSMAKATWVRRRQAAHQFISNKRCFPHISQIGCFQKGLSTKLPGMHFQNKRGVSDAFGLFSRHCRVESVL
jgi:hypothetical protein